MFFFHVSCVSTCLKMVYKRQKYNIQISLISNIMSIFEKVFSNIFTLDNQYFINFADVPTVLTTLTDLNMMTGTNFFIIPVFLIFYS